MIIDLRFVYFRCFTSKNLFAITIIIGAESGSSAKMQEVCSSLDTQISNVIKSESPLNHLQIQTGNQLQSTTTKLGGGGVGGVGINCDKRVADTSYWMATAAESGFINSQPSMAEFLNHLSPESPKIDTTGYSNVATDGINPVPEYPWMKEKKTSRKGNNNNNQGEFQIWENKISSMYTPTNN